MQNETLRAQIEEVEHGFEHLDQVKGLFHGLLSPMSELLAEFEATKARLHETKIKLTFLEDAHEGLSARHAAALEERDIVAEARNALLRENREMGQRAQRVDAALSETQLELRECSATKDKFERLLDVETRQTAGQADEIRRLKDELSSKDQILASLELSLKVASDQGALLSQENATLRNSSQALSSSLDAASRRIAEYESRVVDYESLVDQGKHRIAALEQALSEEQAAHANLRAKHLELAERSRAEMATLNNTVHAVRGRVDVTNKILDQTRGQLREKIEELRAAERRLLENGIQIDGLEKSARSQKDDLAAANERDRRHGAHAGSPRRSGQRSDRHRQGQRGGAAIGDANDRATDGPARGNGERQAARERRTGAPHRRAPGRDRAHARRTPTDRRGAGGFASRASAGPPRLADDRRRPTRGDGGVIGGGARRSAGAATNQRHQIAADRLALSEARVERGPITRNRRLAPTSERRLPLWENPFPLFRDALEPVQRLGG